MLRRDMQTQTKYVIGVDFGSDSVRCLIVGTADGAEIASAVAAYPRWKKRLYCDPSLNRYRQHPLDYIESLGFPCKAVAPPCCGRRSWPTFRGQDNTRWMIEFSVLRPSTAYGSPGEEIRLFLTEDGYQAALQSQQRREIKIKRYARVIEGHILDFKPGKHRRHS